MTYQPINIAKEAVDNYTWTNGAKPKTSAIGGIVRGCGATGKSVSRTDLLTDSDFVPIGTTDTGQTVYGFADSNSAMVQKAYNEYVDFNSQQGSATSALDVFVADHAIFAYKSESNGWLIYTRDGYAPIGGCAKPVVYLYPTHVQSTNVQVGATVKVSDPLYDPIKGWQNVIASPSGQLLYNGQTYSSLFWEGPGVGPYPSITGGSVVPHDKAAALIRNQLAQQGLTGQESDDFMAYWQPRIPNKAFIRLAWFTTQQLNELAPLSITPKPDTVIRVFLDMDGLDQPITIPAQTFSAPNRNGFTVVEWGGLSRTKLY